MEQSRINKARQLIGEVGRGPLRHGMYLPLDSEHAAFPLGGDEPGRGIDDLEEVPESSDEVPLPARTG